MTFHEAFDELKAGKSIRLPSWEPSLKIIYVRTDGAPHLYLESSTGRKNWDKYLVDFLSNKWEIVEQ